MATVKCPECGERVKIREDGKRSRCAECGTAFRVKANSDDEDEKEEEQEEESPRPRVKRKPAKKASGTKIAAIIVGSLLALGLVALAVVLIVRNGGKDGETQPVDQSKVTVENFKNVKPGMDLAEVESILGGSKSSSEDDMRNAFRKAFGEIEAAVETGWSRFGEGTTWRRWEGKGVRIWVAFGKTKEGSRAAFSTGLEQAGGGQKRLEGFMTFAGNTDLDEQNSQRKKEDAIRKDAKWVRGAQARTLLIGDWRKADLDGYTFDATGKLTSYSLFNSFTDGKETTFRVLDDDHVELLPPQMHPNLPTRPVKYEFRVNRDELVLLSIGQSAIPVHGPYYRVPVEPGRPGHTNVLAPLEAALKSGDWAKQHQSFLNLQRLGKSGTALLPTLLELIRDPKDDVAGEAATAIGRLGADAAVAVPALMELLREPNSKRGLRAIGALGLIGPAAKDALPKLKAILAASKEFSEYPMRDSLTYAINRIEGKK